MTASSLDDLEIFVERFETARHREGECTHPADFLPPPAHPDFLTIATELIRIDLELTRPGMRAARLADIRRRLPAVFASSACRNQIAMEDFRLRRQAGDLTPLADYARHWQVDPSHWPDYVLNARPIVRPDAIRGWNPELPGERLGDFELLEELGSGAFARVFLARQLELSDRRVVLKISSADGAEPRRLAQLQHSNIVPVYSVHQHDGWQALCMPFLGRTTLADVARAARAQEQLPLHGAELVSTVRAQCAPTDPTWTDATPSDTQATSASTARASLDLGNAVRLLERDSYVNALVWIAAKLAEGLAHAHERGILHRDLKPANILLADDCQPLILDFNVAAEVACASSQAALVGGTLPYMSPEQLTAFRSHERSAKATPLDARSDLYSLGVVLYELLARRLPFAIHNGASDRALDTMLDDRRAGPADLQRANPQVTPGVAAIVGKCLTFDVNDRYQSAYQLAEDLHRHLRDLPLRYAREGSWRERLGKWARRHPRVASAGSVAVLTLTLIFSGAAAWMARERTVERVAAQAALRQLTDELPLVRAGLGIPGLDEASRREAQTLAFESLSRYGLPQERQWRERPGYARLEAAERKQLELACGELLYWLAQDAARADPVSRAQAAALNSRAQDCFHEQEVPATLKTQAIWLTTGQTPSTPTFESPSRVDSLEEINAAVAALRSGEFAQAEQLLHPATQMRPRDFAAWLWLAHAQWGQGRLADAESSFVVCHALRPDAYVALFQRGVLRLERKQFELAAQDFDTVLEQRPSLIAARINRGIARQSRGDDRGAVEDFDAALAAGANETRVYFLRSRSRRKLGDAAGASADLQEGLIRTPQDELSWLARGYAKMAKPTEALADFQKARELNPNSIMALQNIAGVQSDYLQQLDESLETLDALIARQPARPIWRSSRAVIVARRQRRDAALADLAQADRLVAVREFADDAALVHYQAACVHALLITPDASGKASTTAAIAALRRALPLQWSLAANAAVDPDLKNLRDVSAFRDVIAAAALFRIPISGATP